MLKKVILAALVCGSLSACATTTSTPAGTVPTEKFVAHALSQYGVTTGSKPVAASPSPGV